jgi:hypothetical protein
MPYVTRNGAGAIVTAFEQKQHPGQEFVEPDAAPFRAFLAPRVPGYRDRRAVAYRDTLGKDVGDFIKTLGDVLDVLIAEVEAIGQATQTPRTPEFEALLSAILAVKAAHPKPEDAP